MRALTMSAAPRSSSAMRATPTPKSTWRMSSAGRCRSEIDAGYAEELWVKDARLDNVGGPAFVISNESNAHTEINMEDVVCRQVQIGNRCRLRRGAMGEGCAP